MKTNSNKTKKTKVFPIFCCLIFVLLLLIDGLQAQRTEEEEEGEETLSSSSSSIISSNIRVSGRCISGGKMVVRAESSSPSSSSGQVPAFALLYARGFRGRTACQANSSYSSTGTGTGRGTAVTVATLTVDLLASPDDKDSFCGVTSSSSSGTGKSLQVVVRVHASLELEQDRFFLVTCNSNSLASFSTNQDRRTPKALLTNPGSSSSAGGSESTLLQAKRLISSSSSSSSSGSSVSVSKRLETGNGNGRLVVGSSYLVNTWAGGGQQGAWRLVDCVAFGSPSSSSANRKSSSVTQQSLQLTDWRGCPAPEAAKLGLVTLSLSSSLSNEEEEEEGGLRLAQVFRFRSSSSSSSSSGSKEEEAGNQSEDDEDSDEGGADQTTTIQCTKVSCNGSSSGGGEGGGACSALVQDCDSLASRSSAPGDVTGMLVSGTFRVVRPGKCDHDDHIDDAEQRLSREWLLGLLWMLGVLLLIMFCVNCFLCSSLSCSCIRTVRETDADYDNEGEDNFDADYLGHNAMNNPQTADYSYYGGTGSRLGQQRQQQPQTTMGGGVDYLGGNGAVDYEDNNNQHPTRQQQTIDYDPYSTAALGQPNKHTRY